MPPPDANYKLYVRFEKNGLQSKEIFGELIAQHQTNRFKGAEPILLALSNSIYVFEKRRAERKSLVGPVSNDQYFSMLETAVSNYIHQAYQAPQQKAKLILLVEETGSKKTRVYFN